MGRLAAGSLVLLLALVSAEGALGVEKRVKIAVIDSGSPAIPKAQLCEDEPYDGTSTGMEDRIGHATSVSCLIMRGVDPKKACILPIKYINTVFFKTRATFIEPWEYAREHGAAFINYSSGGASNSDEERRALMEALSHKATIAVAAGNDGTDLDKDCNYFPACYALKGVHVVGARRVARGHYSSNFGGPITDWASDSDTAECGHFIGTSAATAKVMNLLVKERVK